MPFVNMVSADTDDLHGVVGGIDILPRASQVHVLRRSWCQRWQIMRDDWRWGSV